MMLVEFCIYAHEHLLNQDVMFLIVTESFIYIYIYIYTYTYTYIHVYLSYTYFKGASVCKLNETFIRRKKNQNHFH